MESTNELRRGNLVKVDGKIYQVLSLDPCFVGLCKVGSDELLFDVDVKNVEPVELTEEILKKSNLREHKIIGANFRTQTEFSSGSFNIRTGGEYKSVLWVVSFGGVVVKMYQSMLFAHHLQNLFHALTGVELAINFSSSLS